MRRHELRHEMMQDLFGEQSEDEEVIDLEHGSNGHPNFSSDEAEGQLRVYQDGDGESEEVDMIEDVETRDINAHPGESEGERESSLGELDDAGQIINSNEDYGHRAVGSRRRDVADGGSVKLEEHRFAEYGEEPHHNYRSRRELDRKQLTRSVPEIRDVFGDSDDEEEEEFASTTDAKHDDIRSPIEEDEHYDKDHRAEDVLTGDGDQFLPEKDDFVDGRHKEKPAGRPLEIEIPFRVPPADPTKMNMIKVSNVMGIDPNPFDPKTYEEEKTFVTDKAGAKKRLRLENNIVRWRNIRRKDGTTSVESNARFVRWSDGSMQLLIGNEVLDISVQDAQHDQTHLFVRHNKSLLQSQGRVLRKMRFIPSSITSNSHKLLTALVDSRHRKAYKVKNCVTDIDPEREKEEKEKVESQNIRATVLLNRKKEKANRKYSPAVDRRRHLSPGFLEDEDEEDYFNSRYPRRRLEEDLEVEALGEKRILNAKQGNKDLGRRRALSTNKSWKHSLNYSDSDRDEPEYETEEEEDENSHPRNTGEEPEMEYEEDEEEEDQYKESPSDEEEVPKQRGGKLTRHKRSGIQLDEVSPPKKTATHRRMAVVYDSEDD